MGDMYDVVKVNLDTMLVKVVAYKKSRDNANAIEKFAVMQNGVDDQFFSVVKHGQYNDGQKWVGGDD
jgi:hypothetical protein